MIFDLERKKLTREKPLLVVPNLLLSNFLRRTDEWLEQLHLC